MGKNRRDFLGAIFTAADKGVLGEALKATKKALKQERSKSIKGRLWLHLAQLQNQVGRQSGYLYSLKKARKQLHGKNCDVFFIASLALMTELGKMGKHKKRNRVYNSTRQAALEANCGFWRERADVLAFSQHLAAGGRVYAKGLESMKELLKIISEHPLTKIKLQEEWKDAKSPTIENLLKKHALLCVLLRRGEVLIVDRYLEEVIASLRQWSVVPLQQQLATSILWTLFMPLKMRCLGMFSPVEALNLFGLLKTERKADQREAARLTKLCTSQRGFWPAAYQEHLAELLEPEPRSKALLGPQGKEEKTKTSSWEFNLDSGHRAELQGFRTESISDYLEEGRVAQLVTELDAKIENICFLEELLLVIALDEFKRARVGNAKLLASRCLKIGKSTTGNVLCGIAAAWLLLRLRRKGNDGGVARLRILLQKVGLGRVGPVLSEGEATKL